MLILCLPNYQIANMNKAELNLLVSKCNIGVGISRNNGMFADVDGRYNDGFDLGPQQEHGDQGLLSELTGRIVHLQGLSGD
jgi:hypothetical protein